MTQNAYGRTKTLPINEKLCGICNDLHTLPRMGYLDRSKEITKLSRTQRNSERKSATVRRKIVIRQWTTILHRNNKQKTDKAVDESIDTSKLSDLLS